MADEKRAISAILKGLTGELTVNGVKYHCVMPVLSLSDEDVANVTTYVRNFWGNKNGEVAVTEVKAAW